MLESAAAVLVAGPAVGKLPWRPLQLTKRVLGLLGVCEGSALAALTPHFVDVDPGWPVLRGRALDVFVAFRALGGDVRDPVGDLDAVLRARGECAEAERIAEVLDGDRRADLAGLAAAAGDVRVERRWVPRVEVSLAAELADGTLYLPGRVDLMLGGPGTGLPAVVVEVKSGRFDRSHMAELQHYSLLCLLRHGSPPAAMALWYPDGSTVALHVPGSATAAARRVCAAVGAVAEIVAGREPRLRSGAHCSWCAVASDCPAVARREDPGPGGSVGHPGASDATGHQAVPEAPYVDLGEAFFDEVERW